MSQSDEQHIRAVIETWIEATREGDLATVMNLMTEDVVFLTPGNPPMRRDDFEAGSKSITGKMRIDGYPEIQEITVIGDTAICWNKLEITMAPLSGGTSM